MFGCPLYIHNTKKACFVRLRGHPYSHHAFWCPLYVCMSLVCLHATICLDAPVCLDGPHMFEYPPVCLDNLHVCTPPYVWIPLCLDTPLYGWMPHMFGQPLVCLDALHVWLPPVCLDTAKCMVASKGMRDVQTYGGCPNIQGIQTYGGIQMYEVYMDSPSVWQSMLLCVVYVSQAWNLGYGKHDRVLV